jgi:hypothetical protein
VRPALGKNPRAAPWLPTHHIWNEDTMPDLKITIELPNSWNAHVCGGMCDCPKAIARAQAALDADRAQRGAEPRPLSERLHGMRNATPEPDWFDSVAFQAQQLEDLRDIQKTAGAQAAAWAASADAHDAATHSQRRDVLRDAVEATVRDLERAELLPVDHEYNYEPNAEISRVYAGTKVFAAELTGALDTPAAHYVVTTSDEADDDDDAAERFTTDVNAVRAWLLAWACVSRH